MKFCPLFLTALLSHVIAQHGPGPRDLHSLHRRGTIGSCSLEQVGEIFEDITISCGKASAAIITSESIETPAALSTLNTLCKRSCGRILTTFTDTCDFSHIGRVFRTVCASNEDRLCLLASQENNGSEILDLCGPFPPVTCSAECRDAVVEFRSSLGCCVQSTFNSSVLGSDLLPQASPSLWSVCGVETVDPCPDPFGTALSITGSTPLVGTLLLLLYTLIPM